MTGAQDSYLHTLARKAGEDVPVGDALPRPEQRIGRDQYAMKS